MRAECFPPVAREDARLLILGSLPGAVSLAKQEYYAQKQNAFWKIMQRLFGIDAGASFAERAQGLKQSRIALWDVCAAAVRPGSLDADIDPASVVVNDFAGFFAQHRQITRVFFNGRKAEEIYGRKVLPALVLPLQYSLLPSTSPAHAGMRFEDKCLRWQEALEGFISESYECA